ELAGVLCRSRCDSVEGVDADRRAIEEVSPRDGAPNRRGNGGGGSGSGDDRTAPPRPRGYSKRLRFRPARAAGPDGRDLRFTFPCSPQTQGRRRVAPTRAGEPVATATVPGGPSRRGARGLGRRRSTISGAGVGLASVRCVGN